MANKLGQLSCLDSTKNTGFGGCFEDWKQLVGAFIFDSPKIFSLAEIADLQNTLFNLAANDNKSLRMFPVHSFVAPTDNSEGVVLETFDYGGKAIVRDGDNDWAFQFVDGGNCLSSSLRSHNGKRWVLFYDKENKLLGQKSRGGLMAAIPMQFVYTQPWKLATGSKTAAYMIQFVFLAKYVNEERQFVKADFDLSEVTGLQDIEIIVNEFIQGTGVANVTLQAACGAENIYDMFNAQLTAGSLEAFDDENGDPIEVNGLTPVAGTKTFDVAFNTADLPDNGTFTLRGALVSTLVGQNIENYEIGSVVLEMVGSD